MDRSKIKTFLFHMKISITPQFKLPPVMRPLLVSLPPICLWAYLAGLQHPDRVSGEVQMTQGTNRKTRGMLSAQINPIIE